MIVNRIAFLFCCACIALASLPTANADDVTATASGRPMLNTAPVQPAAIPPAYVTLLPTPEDESDDARLTLTPDALPPPTDLWQRIRNGFALPALDSSLIARHEQWYADRPDYVARMTERSERYLYFIVEEVEKRGMPTEIALLPMIESAFNPGANSVASASGIWQFIPSTGRTYGLKQNWWYDGRRNIISATNSALDYLQKLYDQFGDWQLALAAYNWGEGAVERAQEYNRRRGKPTDYASLKMPNETRNYVPKLLAVKNIVSDPESFGLTLQPIPDKPYFTSVITARHIDVKLAAQLAEIPLEEFTALNPAHNRPVILEENSTVLLPVDKADIFRANLESHGESLVSWQEYKTRKGESLAKVAPRFGLSVSALRSVNGLSSRAKLSNGQPLLVPLNGDAADSEFEAFNTHLLPTQRTQGRAITHTVRRGETLSSIARRYKVSVTKLRNWNDNLEKLKPGQQITIVLMSRHHSTRSSAAHRSTKTGKQRTNQAASKSGRSSANSMPGKRVDVTLNP